MASLNKVLLLGNLTRDPDCRTTKTGTTVCSLSLAVSQRMKNGEDEVLFIDVTVWGKSGEACREHLAKGSSILIDGRLKLDQWERQDGSGTNSKISVIADNVQFIRTASGREHRNDGGGYSANASSDRYAYGPGMRQHEDNGAPW